MVKEVRIYIEGGGDAKDTKAFLREGFSKFMRDLVEIARSRRIRWQPVVCGGRNATFDAFCISVRQNPDAFNVLLVDAEGVVSSAPWAHLAARDGWRVEAFHDDQCHLMTQAMEAWLIADPTALERFYGDGFHRNSIPANPNVELIPKSSMESSLAAATRGTKKGVYHKIDHGSKLLGLVDTSNVRRASAHCERLFGILTAKMG